MVSDSQSACASPGLMRSAIRAPMSVDCSVSVDPTTPQGMQPLVPRNSDDWGYGCEGEAAKACGAGEAGVRSVRHCEAAAVHSLHYGQT